MPTKYKGQELSDTDEDLIMLRDELYCGDWDMFTSDLIKRQDSRPYVYKTVARIKNDLILIHFLRRRLGE